MIVQGMSKSPRHPFLVTYIDDNVPRVRTGYYVGILITLAIMGPVISYTLGGVFSRMYVTLEETDLHPRHPNWIGAWWLGFVVFGIASMLCAIPLYFFPKKLHGAPKYETKRKTGTWIFAQEVKTYMFLLKNILLNPVYMLLLASTISLLFGVAAMQAFMPKYIENQFGFEAWRANISIAGLSLSMACLGTYIGGWVTKRLKMGPLTALKLNCILYFLVIVFFGLCFIFGCEQPEVFNSPGSPVITCMNDCNCDNNGYFPICGVDNKNYFSPCHAGCKAHDTTYRNCSCIEGGGTASAGTCEYNCLIPYFVAMGLSFFVSTFAIMPKITAEIRSVTDDEKPLSIGMMTLLGSLLGWLVAPVILGKTIDSTCLIWKSFCGRRGACLLYDMSAFRFRLHGLVLGSRAFSFLCTVGAQIVAIKIKKWENKKELVPGNN